MCVEQPLLHGVCVSFHLHAGPRFEHKENNGCSHMLEHMLFRGTPEFPNAHALAVAMERLGGTLYGATDMEHGHMSVTLPPETLEDGIKLFAKVITAPVFSDLDVEKGIVREEILEGIDEDGRCIEPDDLLRATMYPSHPLGMPVTGTLESLDAMSESDIVDHHKQFYTGTNSVLSIAGPIDASKCEQIVGMCFSEMPVGVELK
ncbi:MAG: insulinase family protein, partial [Polyangiaceae bacterium]|nr:insulinase family protein [Polyangiaceae bacterium]